MEREGGRREREREGEGHERQGEKEWEERGAEEEKVHVDACVSMPCPSLFVCLWGETMDTFQGLPTY